MTMRNGSATLRFHLNSRGYWDQVTAHTTALASAGPSPQSPPATGPRRLAYGARMPVRSAMACFRPRAMAQGLAT